MHLYNQNLFKGVLLDSQKKAIIVGYILQGKTEKALSLLSKMYSISVPKVKIGLPKGYRGKTSACYSPGKATIFLLNYEKLTDSFTLLHEFYHHLRTSIDQKHKGTEKYANQFAREFIDAYKSVKERELTNDKRL